jgi:hypothetical protein
MTPSYQYSADFYTWLILCTIPSAIFLYALLRYEKARIWTKDAVENNDKKAHQADLTFLLVSVAGWMLMNATFVAIGLFLFEKEQTLFVAAETFGFASVCFGLNKYFNNRQPAPATESDYKKMSEQTNV